MDSGFVASPVTTTPDGKPAVNNEVLKQIYNIYNQFGKSGFSEKPVENKDDKPDLAEIAKRVDEQLHNLFCSIRM